MRAVCMYACMRFSFGSFCCWLSLLDVLFLLTSSLYLFYVSFLLTCLFFLIQICVGVYIAMGHTVYM